MLLETFLNDVTVERVAIRGEQARLQERRRVIDLVLFGLGKENVVINHLRAWRIECNAITYPLVEFRGGHSDQLGLLVPLQLEKACPLFHDLAQQEREQLFVISRLRQILSEALLIRRLSNVSPGSITKGKGRDARAEVFS